MHRKGVGPAIVCLPAFGDCRESWRPLIDALSDRFEVAVMELPDLNGAGWLPVDPDLASIAGVIAAVLGQTWAAPLTIVGHSAGFGPGRASRQPPQWTVRVDRVDRGKPDRRRRLPDGTGSELRQSDRVQVRPCRTGATAGGRRSSTGQLCRVTCHCRRPYPVAVRARCRPAGPRRRLRTRIRSRPLPDAVPVVADNHTRGHPQLRAATYGQPAGAGDRPSLAVDRRRSRAGRHHLRLRAAAISAVNPHG